MTRSSRMRRRKATRIPSGKRRASSREIAARVRAGYSPRYAAHRAYEHYGHDPRLTAAQRRAIPASRFALPERRALPVHDAAHVRNAAARLEQMRRRGTVTAAEYQRAHAAITSRKRALGIGEFRARRPARAARRAPHLRVAADPIAYPGEVLSPRHIDHLLLKDYRISRARFWHAATGGRRRALLHSDVHRIVRNLRRAR